MYVQKYEIACSITSSIIVITSTYIMIITKNYIIIFITLAGLTSLLTRLYRIKKKAYVMNHWLVYSDIFFSILAFSSFLYKPFEVTIYYNVIISFILMIIAAIMSWNIFPINLVEESFYFQFTGHAIISVSLIYSTFLV